MTVAFANCISKAVTDNFDSQLFSSGQVALGIYGKLCLISHHQGGRRSVVDGNDPRHTSWSRKTHHLSQASCNVHQGLHHHRSLLYHRRSHGQILHFTVVPAHLRQQSQTYDRLLGRRSRSLSLQHRADCHVHLSVHARTQGLGPCDSWHVPQHLYRSDHPGGDQRGCGFCDCVLANAVDLGDAHYVEEEAAIAGHFHVGRIVRDSDLQLIAVG